MRKIVLVLACVAGISLPGVAQARCLGPFQVGEGPCPPIARTQESDPAMREVRARLCMDRTCSGAFLVDLSYDKVYLVGSEIPTGKARMLLTETRGRYYLVLHTDPDYTKTADRYARQYINLPLPVFAKPH